MYVAELSALDLGSFVVVRGKTAKNRSPKNYVGYLTEVHHNATKGKTRLGIVRLDKPLIDKEYYWVNRWVEIRYGRNLTFDFGSQVQIVSPPPTQ